MAKTDFVAIISDMHLAPAAMGADRRQNVADMPERRLTHLTAVFEELREGPPPKAVLFGGDNANQPVSRPDFRTFAHEQMKRFEAIAPCYAIPGNHDVGSTVGWHHHDPGQLDAACRAFEEDWTANWTLEVNGFRIIAVNTQIFGAGLDREKAQSMWLRRELAEPAEHGRILYGHTPFYLKTPDDDFDDGSEMMCLRPRARKPLLEILNDAPPDIALTTHAHRFWMATQGSWHWIGAPATALGQHEMHAVPSHNLPPGDDHVGWIRLWLAADGKWEAENRHCY